MLIDECSEKKTGLIKREASECFDSRSSEDLFGSIP